MPSYEVDVQHSYSATLTVEADSYADAVQQAVEDAKLIATGSRWTPTCVANDGADDAKDVVGRCEGCGVWLIDGDAFHVDTEESIYLCKKCGRSDSENCDE